ncbi:hypothetical protein FIV42_09225 [Persicimonas caeni]|uniref:GtrA/DPMS transmembrane domain-containing protein n=1 Tax=Persicimonas caeni TaxID=2292766 RepID=A0A4Y6PSB9_PERCE|nr:GtrA family protein [Persicimonas caeni]QDG50907.1 hypothetical protein FIV42_09225 [Persicimonas caeni]QED32128.1 hypothetical protein FRD00_09220 [Persicimonas caeni]
MKSWKRHLLDLSGASVASATATAVDGIIYAVLLWTFVEWGDISVGMAAGLGAFVGGLIHYSMSRFWVFERFQAPLKQSAVAYFAMSWLAAAFHGTLTQSFVEYLGPSVGWFASKGLVWVFWIYPLSRYVVFGGLGANSAKQTVAERD